MLIPFRRALPARYGAGVIRTASARDRRGKRLASDERQGG
jgi:hypothetical protein